MYKIIFVAKIFENNFAIQRYLFNYKLNISNIFFAINAKI